MAALVMERTGQLPSNLDRERMADLCDAVRVWCESAPAERVVQMDDVDQLVAEVNG